MKNDRLLTITPTTDMSTAERDAIWQWLRTAFAYLTADYTWAEPDYHLRLWQAEQLIGHVDITLRQAQVGGQTVNLGGIGGVVVLPEYRSQGLAGQMLVQAQAFLADPLKVDFGLLICEPALAPFYTGNGWISVAESLQCLQPAGPATMTAKVMILPVQRRDWPDGPIDLCGLPW